MQYWTQLLEIGLCKLALSSRLFSFQWEADLPGVNQDGRSAMSKERKRSGLETPPIGVNRHAS